MIDRTSPAACPRDDGEKRRSSAVTKAAGEFFVDRELSDWDVSEALLEARSGFDFSNGFAFAIIKYSHFSRGCDAACRHGKLSKEGPPLTEGC
jgi:hypothetical protein